MKKITNKIKALSMIREHLQLHLRYFSVFSPDQRQKFISKLKEFIEFYYRNPVVSNYILNDTIIKKKLTTLRKLCLLYEKKLEKQYVKDCLKGDCIELNRYVQDYEKFLKTEGIIAGINGSSKIIILGSGYLPGTAMLLTKLFNVKCTCIDNDIEAIATSRKFIKSLSLDKKIYIEFGDATTYPLDHYDCIYVTGSCIPKQAIFDHIYNEVNNAKIIYRKPFGLYKLFYTPSSSKEINKFSIVKTIDHGKNYPFDSVLLTKKE